MTGVQTCALPISTGAWQIAEGGRYRESNSSKEGKEGGIEGRRAEEYRKRREG